MSGIIHFQGVQYGYASNSQQLVLKNIDLIIRRGDFVSLIGGNGSGKSTLAKLCNGLYKPTAGTVWVDGRDTRDCSVAELSSVVSYCYQNPDHQIFQSTVWEEVSFGPRNLGLTEEEVEQRVNEALQAVGIAHLRNEEPYFAGKGTRQKIAVASILAMKPQVIVLDEPTTGLDHRGVEDMMSLTLQLHQQGHTILMITHDMRLVAEYSRRVIVMSSGEIIGDGTPQDVFSQPDSLARAQVEPPSAARFSILAGVDKPHPLTFSTLKERLAKELNMRDE